ncbi:hypothetical protein L1987_40493 [Smallanthus sonchifolius]|uniref:Uncharacterized protein n=1 Tax=Smallanthus sonchifolius TaxID=185202 RepID=A0ACB9GUL1_9ASTR|nr:hypothetical protein L1987_40493 [Smallanthus sonchifolius]
MSYPGTLLMGCFQRMGYRGRPNDTQARKGGLVSEWRYFMHIIIQCLSPRKAGTDGLKNPLQAAMVALTLNKIFTDCTKVKQHNVVLIPVQTLLFGHLINPDYVEPPNDNWFHPEELAQGHGQNVKQPKQQPVQVPQQQQEHEQDLRMNMDDFVDDAVNSPIHEAEGNVVTENDSSSSSSETILPVCEETDSDASRDFCSDHYERLAEIPLANSGKRIKSQARRPRRKSVLDPPSGSVLGKRTFMDESSDTDSDFNPDPKAQKLMSTSIAAAHSSLSIQRNDDEDNDPTGNAEGDRQYADVNPISTVQGESISKKIEGNKDASRVNEEVFLLEFFADSEEEEAEKIECLDDIDELFNDIEDDVSDNDVEEGEIVEIEIEKNKDNVTYEGSDGLNVPYNFIQDVVIPEFSYEGVTDSMDSIEYITMPEDTAKSKMDTDDENVQSNINAEADTTHTVSPKVNEEPMMYRNTGMTREQWREVVNSWMKVLPKSQAQPAQKEKYGNKERCVGRIISWFYDNDTKLFAIKRSDGVQYLKPRIKYFNTLPRCEMNGLASKPLINRSKFGLADVIANLMKRESGLGKYEKLKSQKGKRVRIIDQKIEKVTWKYKFKPARVVHKIPLKKIPQDFLGNMKWWYVDVNTGEARIEDKDNKVIVCFYDTMNLINFSKKVQRTLRNNEIMFIDEWREQGLQYKRVLEICRRYGVHAGSRLPDNWKSSSLRQKIEDQAIVKGESVRT